jgi:hypothetical protein
MFMPINNIPWDFISLIYIVKLPPSSGYDYLSYCRLFHQDGTLDPAPKQSLPKELLK